MGIGRETYRAAVEGATCDHCQLRDVTEEAWRSYAQDGVTPFQLADGLATSVYNNVQVAMGDLEEGGINPRTVSTDFRLETDEMTPVGDAASVTLEDLGRGSITLHGPTEDYPLYPPIYYCVGSNVREHCLPTDQAEEHPFVGVPDADLGIETLSTIARHGSPTDVLEYAKRLSSLPVYQWEGLTVDLPPLEGYSVEELRGYFMTLSDLWENRGRDLRGGS